jgi:hypothetical protein
MSDQENEHSAEDSEQSDEQPVGSEESQQSEAAEQSAERPDTQQDQEAQQSDEQSGETSADESDQAADGSTKSEGDSDQATAPEATTVDESDQPAEQSDQQPADSDQSATSESGTDTVALADADGGGDGGGSGTVSGAGSAVVDPFPAVNSIGFSAPDASLATCINAASQDPKVKDLCTGVIDLTGLGANAAALPYVGHNDSERLYVGSVAKIYPLLAAFELRQRVTLQANAMIFLQGLSTSTPGWQTKVFDTIQKAWQPQLDAKFPGLPKGTHPNFSKILELATDGTASFRKEFTDWIKAATKRNDEAAAGNYIRALSYPYINGVLESAGFFNSATNTGLWISGDYNGNDWLANDKAGKPIDAKWQKPGHAVSNFVGTAQQLTRFVGLIATGNLAVSASSSDIEALLGTPWLVGILTNASPARSFTSAVGKVGIGTWDLRDHDAAIGTLERDPTNATKTIRYVVVVLGSDRLNTQMAQLEIAYHDCIVAQHP